MADTSDLKSEVRKGVRVRVSPGAPLYSSFFAVFEILLDSTGPVGWRDYLPRQASLPAHWQFQLADSFAQLH